MVCRNVNDIHYQEPSHLVFGSFNHTRKLTRASQKRFGAGLACNPDAVLQFRSHSFHDPDVRRHFLDSFAGHGVLLRISCSLCLMPLHHAAAMADYGRIHLHLDTFPVSGTTTTLDSLAMGIPVLTARLLTTPERFQLRFLNMLVLPIMFVPIRTTCRVMPVGLAERYRSAAARRALAKQVRQSPICDDRLMPSMFVEQLQLMLRSFNLLTL